MALASSESPLALQCLPSFSDPWMWCLKPGEDTTARALRMLYRRSLNQLERAEVDLPEALSTELSERLAALRLKPFAVEPEFGLDGTIHSLHFQAGSHRLHLSWWSAAPPAWREAEALYHWLHGELEALR